MPKINKTRYAILGILNVTPCSGYDIKKYCDKGISHFWNENFGHIYPVLKQLETEKLITKTVEQSEGKPSRHVYSITQKGKDELVEWLLQPEEPVPARLELMLKLTFAKNIKPENILEKIERVKRNHEKKLQEYLEIEQAFTADERTRKDEGYPYWLATLRYGIYGAQFRIKWCEETIEAIKGLSAGKD